MTAPSIKEALEYLEAAANWMQRYLDTYGELGDDATQANIDDWHDAAKHVRATLSPPAGERREAIARIMHGDCDLRTVLMAWFEPEYPSPEETNFAYTQADKTIDAIILASGLVQDENSIRADEREKCAKIAESCHGVDEGDLPSDVRAGERIAANIRTGEHEK